MMFWMIDQLATSMKVDFTEGWRVCYDDKIKAKNIELMDVILVVVQEEKVLFVFSTSESSYIHTSNWNQRQVQTFQGQIFVSMSWGIEWTEDWSFVFLIVFFFFYHSPHHVFNIDQGYVLPWCIYFSIEVEKTKYSTT
jgi:hypothetical protein